MYNLLMIFLLLPVSGQPGQKSLQFEPHPKLAPKTLAGPRFPYRAKIISPMPQLNSAIGRSMGYTDIERHRWGYLTQSGDIAIQPQFALARPFRGAYAVAHKLKRLETETRVQVTTTAGIVDRAGQWILKPKFDQLADPSEGLARAKLPRPIFRDAGDKTVYEGYIDMTGQFVIELELGEKMGEAGDFSQGLAWVHPMLSAEVAKKHMNDDDIKTLTAFFGTSTIPERVRTANTPYGYIDQSGKMVIAARYKRVTDFSEGRAAVQDAKSLKWGFIDRTGAWLVKPRFDWASPYSNGIAAVQQGHRCGYISLQKEMVIAPRFKDCFQFKEGQAVVVRDDGSWAFVNRVGQERPVFAKSRAEAIVDVGDFSEGLSAVKLKTPAGVLWGFVDEHGALQIKPTYTNRQPPSFKDGLARVKVNVRGPSTELWNKGQMVDIPHVGYINRRGQWVFGPVPAQTGF